MKERHRLPHLQKATIKVLCAECGAGISHRCHDPYYGSDTSLRQALIKFLTWVPEFHLYEEVEKAMAKAGRKEGCIGKDQDFTKSAFFGAQPWTYAMGNKHFGREFSGVIDTLISAAGFDVQELRESAYKAMDAKEAESTQRTDLRAARQKEADDAVKLFRSKKASLDEKVALLDKIIADYTRGTDPVPSVENRCIQDPWLTETLRRLDTRYGGGINPDVNRLRIEAARKVAVLDGVFAVSLRSADGEEIFSRRFPSEDEVKAFIRDASKVALDAFSEDPLARAVCLRVARRGQHTAAQTYLRKGNAWALAPKKEKAAE